jgi:recombination protein RecT
MTSDQKQLKPIDEVRQSLERMAPQFKMALPAHIPVEKFNRAVQTAIANNPNLLKADRSSLYSACMKSAEMGLFANGREASLVCFGDKVTFMPQISGVLKLIRNSGELTTILAEIVHDQDEFSYWVDSDGQHISHRPKVFGGRGDVIGAYALAKMKDGAVYVEVMDMDQINSVRKVSRSADKGPWVTFPGEMMKKTVIRRLSKRLPLSTDIESVIAADDDLYEFTPQPKEQHVNEVKDVNADEGESKLKSKSKPSKLARAIKDQSELKNHAPGADNPPLPEEPQAAQELI